MEVFTREQRVEPPLGAASVAPGSLDQSAQPWMIWRAQLSCGVLPRSPGHAE